MVPFKYPDEGLHIFFSIFHGGDVPPTFLEGKMARFIGMLTHMRMWDNPVVKYTNPISTDKVPSLWRDWIDLDK